jgi:hypothetical protein
MPPKLLDFQPAFEAVLPPDWVLIGRCRAGEASHVAGGGCFVLAHAEIGVALVDLLPMRTPQAEAHLRRLLNAVDFSFQCRGYLPIIQVEVTAEELGGLRARIEDAFAYDQVLTIADRGRWLGVLRRTLQASVTWEALDGPLPEPSLLVRRWRPWMTLPVARMVRAGLVGCGVLGIFSLGFVTALLMPAEPAPAPPGFGFGLVAEAAPLPLEPAPAPVAAEPPPMLVPAPMLAAAPARAAESRAVDLAEPAGPPPPPDAPPLTVAATTRHPVRTPLPIDRRCSDAVFRFQQGASLTDAEMAHVRRGCASMR